MPAKKEKRLYPHSYWRQRGCDSEVVVPVVLCLMMLGGTMVWPESEKIAENEYFWCYTLRPQMSESNKWIHIIQIYESKPNGALSEVLPNRYSFGRAESSCLANYSACITARYPPHVAASMHWPFLLPSCCHDIIHPSPKASMLAVHSM